MQDSPLGVKFDGDQQQLGLFLAHVLTYMQEYELEIPIEGTKRNPGIGRGCGQRTSSPAV